MDTITQLITPTEDRTAVRHYTTADLIVRRERDRLTRSGTDWVVAVGRALTKVSPRYLSPESVRSLSYGTRHMSPDGSVRLTRYGRALIAHLAGETGPLTHYVTERHGDMGLTACGSATTNDGSTDTEVPMGVACVECARYADKVEGRS